MKLEELGLDSALAQQAAALCGADLAPARVTAVDRGRYLVRGEAGEIPAELTGKFLHLAESSAELPCVGDWVCVQVRDGGTQASIHHLLPRRTYLRRKAAGRDVEHQMIAAMRELGLLGAGEGIADTFADIHALAAQCRYPDCTHGGEPGCAVHAAVERGELSAAHLRNFQKLRKESEFHELSQQERRKKDRAFGRFLHAYKKQRD